MENHKLKTLTVSYTTRKGEKKTITNHELHTFLERGLYRGQIAEELNISQSLLRKVMEAANMWKMRTKTSNVEVVNEEKKETPVVEQEIVKPVKSRRLRAIKVTNRKVVNKTQEIDKILQEELDKVQNMRKEFASTMNDFYSKLKKATEILELNSN